MKRYGILIFIILMSSMGFAQKQNVRVYRCEAVVGEYCLIDTDIETSVVRRCESLKGDEAFPSAKVNIDLKQSVDLEARGEGQAAELYRLVKRVSLLEDVSFISVGTLGAKEEYMSDQKVRAEVIGVTCFEVESQ